MKLQQLLESEFDNIDPTNLTDKREWLTTKKEALEKEQKLIVYNVNELRTDIRLIINHSYPNHPAFTNVLDVNDVPEIVNFQQQIRKLQLRSQKISTQINNINNQLTPSKNTGLFTWQFIVMTGFRDDKLELYIDDNGGTVQSGVNSKTTLLIALDPSKNSNKIQKAKSLRVQIMSLTAFKQKYGIT